MDGNGQFQQPHATGHHRCPQGGNQRDSRPRVDKFQLDAEIACLGGRPRCEPGRGVVAAMVVQGIYHPLTKPLLSTYPGLLPSALGFVLRGYALKHLTVTASTSLRYLMPGVALLISHFWLGDVPLPIELLGGAVIVAGEVAIGHNRIAATLRRQPARL